jgi:acetyl-CoA carboxylase biotin carboxyl carrier protein
MILDDELKQLMEYLENSSFVEFEIEREGVKLKLVRRGAGAPESPIMMMAPAASAPAPIAAAPAAPVPVADAADQHVVKSPIVGTFYRSSAPDSKPFANIGDRVAKGQILCIVEAMKLMNEIESDCDGEVLEILVSNGQPVEFGEPMFRLRTSGARPA